MQKCLFVSNTYNMSFQLVYYELQENCRLFAYSHIVKRSYLKEN